MVSCNSLDPTIFGIESTITKVTISSSNLIVSSLMRFKLIVKLGTSIKETVSLGYSKRGKYL